MLWLLRVRLGVILAGSRPQQRQDELLQGRDIVDSRALRSSKLEPADFWVWKIWKNVLILLLHRLDVSGLDYFTAWVSAAFGFDAESICKGSSELHGSAVRLLVSFRANRRLE